MSKFGKRKHVDNVVADEIKDRDARLHGAQAATRGRNRIPTVKLVDPRQKKVKPPTDGRFRDKLTTDLSVQTETVRQRKRREAEEKTRQDEVIAQEMEEGTMLFVRDALQKAIDDTELQEKKTKHDSIDSYDGRGIDRINSFPEYNPFDLHLGEDRVRDSDIIPDIEGYQTLVSDASRGLLPPAPISDTIIDEVGESVVLLARFESEFAEGKSTSAHDWRRIKMNRHVRPERLEEAYRRGFKGLCKRGPEK